MGAGDALNRRLFFAFELDEGCRAAVERLVDELARRLDAHGGRAKGRVKWVEPENFHLTVKFLGSTSETRLGEIRKLLQTPFDSRPFELRFDRLGAFPDRGAPRVIWLGASAVAPEAEVVQRQLEGRLAAVGVPPEGRPFRAHLTVGRFREPGRREDGRMIREFVLRPVAPLVVDHLTLYESHLSSRGPSYDPLVRVGLREELGGAGRSHSS